jgi:hypothetical protein
MPNYSGRLLPETMRSINSASFTGSYQTLGTVLAHPSRMLIFVNNSGVLVTISWDGTNDAFVILPGAAVILDETSNAVSGAVLASAQGTQFYAKGAASVGLVYLSTFYAG